MKTNVNIINSITTINLSLWVKSFYILLFIISSNSYANKDYTLYEVDPVRPVAHFNKGKLVEALNTPDHYVELYKSKKMMSNIVHQSKWKCAQ